MASERATSYEVDTPQHVGKDAARREPPVSNPRRRLIELKSPNEPPEDTSRADNFSSDSHAGHAINQEKLHCPENSNSNSSGSQMAILATDTDLYAGGPGIGGGGESTQTSSTDQKCNSMVESRYRPQKYCAVCGDKAIACNFNAVTCESCKAFFRRNAFKEQRLKCLFENRCIIDRVTRRFCSKCRLLKCLSIGMKREWILTDEQKQIKRAKIMQNKQNRQQQVTTSSLDQTTTSSERSAQWKRKKYSDCDSSLSSNASNSPSTSAVTTYAAQLNGSQCQQTTVSDSCASGCASKTSKMTAGQLHIIPTIASTRDAATCCPDKSDFVTGTMGHYCTLAHQCQFCAIKLQHEQQALCNAMCSGQQQKPIQFLSNYDQGLHVPVYDSEQQASQMHGQFIYSNSNNNNNHQQQQAPGTSMTGVPMLISTNNYNHNSVPSTGAHQVKFDASTPIAASCCCPSDASPNQSYPPSTILEQPASNQGQAQTTGLVSQQQQQQQDSPKPQLHILKPALNKNQPRPSNFVDLLKRTSTAVNLTRANATSATDDSPRALSDSHPFGEHSDFASSPSGQINSAKRKELTCLVGAKHELEEDNLGEQASAKESEKYNGSQTAINQRVECGKKASTIGKSDKNEDTETHAGATAQRGHVAPMAFDRSKFRCVMWKGESYFEPASSEEEASDRILRLNFNDTERQLMFEMMEATQYIFDDHNDRRAPPATLDEIVLFCDFSLRKLIKSVKQIGAFRILSMDDQILLLKTACFKVLLLRSAYHYEDEFDGFYDQQSGHRMKMDILKKSKKSLVYEKHMDLLQKIALPLRRDRIILSILAMALLFDPNVNLKHTSSVELDNLIYLSILRKYLVSLQPDPLAKYKRLVEALQVLNACNEEYNVFFSKDFQPEQVTPLLIEIFDIPINSGSV